MNPQWSQGFVRFYKCDDHSMLFCEEVDPLEFFALVLLLCNLVQFCECTCSSSCTTQKYVNPFRWIHSIEEIYLTPKSQKKCMSRYGHDMDSYNGTYLGNLVLRIVFWPYFLHWWPSSPRYSDSFSHICETFLPNYNKVLSWYVVDMIMIIMTNNNW